MFRSHDELRELISFGVTPEELAQCGFDPKAPDSFSITARNPVCAAGDLPLVAWLLEIGADPGAPSADGFTPLLGPSTPAVGARPKASRSSPCRCARALRSRAAATGTRPRS